MATIQSVSASPTSVPVGSSSTVTVAFNTSPGTASRVAHVAVLLDGGQQGSADITLQGTPAETTPNVLVGSTGTGWEIRTDAGTLTASGSNRFSLLNN